MLQLIDQKIIAANRAWDRLHPVVALLLLMVLMLPMITFPSIVVHSRPLAFAALGWTFLLMMFRIYPTLRRQTP